MTRWSPRIRKSSPWTTPLASALLQCMQAGLAVPLTQPSEAVGPSGPAICVTPPVGRTHSSRGARPSQVRPRPPGVCTKRCASPPRTGVLLTHPRMPIVMAIPCC
eukprot:3392692-Amphidinium_carterae.1